MIGVTGRKRVSSGMLYYFKQCNEVYAAPRDEKPRQVFASCISATGSVESD